MWEEETSAQSSSSDPGSIPAACCDGGALSDPKCHFSKLKSWGREHPSHAWAVLPQDPLASLLVGGNGWECHEIIFSLF